ncbi:MAG: hypothetical protein JW955_25925 [Sedimentisphaerales bacterium]|nr:hypothetical protein [Sedimentisphaerales bacterium]
MRGTGVVVVTLVVAVGMSAARGEDIKFDYTLTTDKSRYTVGEQVRWKLDACIQGPTRGIKDLNVSLQESRGEEMGSPLTETFPVKGFPGLYASAYIPVDYYQNPRIDSYFSYKNYFGVSAGTGSGGVVSGLGASQFVGPEDSTNFPKALDKTGGEFCEGTFTVTQAGSHALTVTHDSGSVWLNEQGDFGQLTAAVVSPANFEVAPVVWLPQVRTEAAAWMLETRAFVTASLLDNGGQPCKIRFVYWKEGGPQLETQWYCCLEQAGYSEVIENLEPWTTYSYRAEAMNDAGLAAGDVLTFKTRGGPAYDGDYVQRNAYWDYTITVTPAISETPPTTILQVGDVVHWKLAAHVVGPTRGIESFQVSLIESRREKMTILPTAQVPTWIYPGVYVSNFYLDHKVYGYFTYKNYFQAAGITGGPGVIGAGASHFVRPTNVGIFPNALDKTGGDLCEGWYTLTKPGFHDLDTIHGGGTVYLDDDGNTQSLRGNDGNAITFYVSRLPMEGFSGDVSVLNVIGQQMGRTGCSNANNWCDGADFYRDGQVDLLDAANFFFYYAGGQIDVIDDMYTYQDVLIPGEPNRPERLIVLGTGGGDFEIGNDSLVFSADDLEQGEELWQVNLKTNESSVSELVPGLQGSYPQMFTRVGTQVYFVAVTREYENEYYWGLYRLDPNGHAPTLIKDSICAEWVRYKTPPTWTVMTSFNGRLIFTQVYRDLYSSRDIWSLWQLDGGTQAVSQIADLGSTRIEQCVVNDGRICFATARYTEYVGWKYSLSCWDGVRYAVQRDDLPACPSSLTTLGERICFKAGTGLWASDGTTSGTLQITSNLAIAAGSSREPFVVMSGWAFFDAFDAEGGTELWKSDGTASGTMRVADLASGTDSSLPQNLTATFDTVYFTTRTDANDTLLWKSDGTAAGTASVASFVSADDKAPRLHNFTGFADRLYFLVDDVLWMYRNGTVAPVEETASLKVLQITRVGDKLVLVVDAGQNGQAVWVFAPED